MSSSNTALNYAFQMLFSRTSWDILTWTKAEKPRFQHNRWLWGTERLFAVQPSEIVKDIVSQIRECFSKMKWQRLERNLISDVISMTHDWFACLFIHLQKNAQAFWESLSKGFSHVDSATVLPCSCYSFLFL